MIKKISAFIVGAVLCFSSVYCDNSEINDTSAVSGVTFSDFDMSVNDGEPVRGVDISSITAIENAGVKFYNEKGKEQDIFKTLSEHGVNYIRVRVWNEPYSSDGNSYGGGNNDVYTAGIIGKRAAEYNMKLLVDIQYSDFWADPEKQTRPKYWSEHSNDVLAGEIYKWTTWVLTSITDAGGDIGMVQVGNETNCFFCGEKDMYEICNLFSSGNKAVRDFDKNILIAHHFANPSNVSSYLWYAKVMNECNLDYDIFATSYYPYWHGTTQNLTDVLKTIGETYNKYVMVAETAYPYTNDDGDNFGNAVSASSSGCDFRYDISVEGQAQCIADVFQAVADTGRYGIGAFYWEPAWLGVPDVSWSEQKELWDKYGSGWATNTAAEYDFSVKESGGSSYDNQALFDFRGNPLESLKVFDNIYPKKKAEKPEEGSQIPSGAYRIKNLSSGMYLTVSDGEGKTGSNVIQYTADGAAEYNTWNIVESDDGYYQIYSALGDGNTFLLDIDCGKADDRTNIGIYTDTDADAQKFKFIESENSGYVIVTKSTNDKSAVEIADASPNDGANIQQFSRNGNDCQIWMLEPVEEYNLNGDVNGDGVIDIFDMALLRNDIISGKNRISGDVNNDGNESVADLVSMNNYLIGKEKIEIHSHGTPHNTIFPYSKH